MNPVQSGTNSRLFPAYHIEPICTISISLSPIPLLDTAFCLVPELFNILLTSALTIRNETASIQSLGKGTLLF
jgi:hypothetical protein